MACELYFPKQVPKHKTKAEVSCGWSVQVCIFRDRKRWETLLTQELLSFLKQVLGEARGGPGSEVMLIGVLDSDWRHHTLGCLLTLVRASLTTSRSYRNSFTALAMLLASRRTWTLWVYGLYFTPNGRFTVLVNSLFKKTSKGVLISMRVSEKTKQRTEDLVTHRYRHRHRQTYTYTDRHTYLLSLSWHQWPQHHLLRESSIPPLSPFPPPPHSPILSTNPMSSVLEVIHNPSFDLTASLRASTTVALSVSMSVDEGNTELHSNRLLSHTLHNKRGDRMGEGRGSPTLLYLWDFSA